MSSCETFAFCTLGVAKCTAQTNTHARSHTHTTTHTHEEGDVLSPGSLPPFSHAAHIRMICYVISWCWCTLSLQVENWIKTIICITAS